MNKRPTSAGLIVLLLLLIVVVLGACGPVSLLMRNTQHDVSSAAANAAEMPGGGMQRGGGQGMGMHRGQGSGMMARHHAAVPAAYADLSNPVAADDASLARGEESYTTLCASCHGDTGMGEGLAGQALDPAPAPIAHTSQMMSDGYLFWRVTEGGAHFETAMPVWQEVLDEQLRCIRRAGDGQHDDASEQHQGNGAQGSPAAPAQNPVINLHSAPVFFSQTTQYPPVSI